MSEQQIDLLTPPVFPFVRKKTVYNIYPLSCLHVGHACCNEKKLKEDIATIAKDPYGIVFLLGDLCDSVLYSDKRFDAESIADWVYDLDADVRNKLGRHALVDKQVERTAELLKPIATQIFGVVRGNHEEKILKTCSTDMTYRIASELSKTAGRAIKYFGVEGFVRLRFGRGKGDKIRTSTHVETLTVHLHHGHGGGRKSGSKVNRLADFFIHSNAELVLTGHGHERLDTDADTYHIPSRGKTTMQRRVAVMTGTYLQRRTEDKESYAVRGAYAQHSLGYVKLAVQPEPRKITIIK